VYGGWAYVPRRIKKKPVFATKIQQQPPANFQKQSSVLFLLHLKQ
jgi:hypothetical protein